MKEIFDEVSLKCSEITTKRYSTSFSLGIKLLDKSIHNPIYSIYGFVRLADEIVDSFHEFEKKNLLLKFKNDTKKSIFIYFFINHRRPYRKKRNCCTRCIFKSAPCYLKGVNNT